MHQAILSRAGRNADVIKDVPLRFLRSSSASLPAQVMEALNETFNAPVVEAYGMIEAAHQMCCNRLDKQKPDRRRRRRTRGRHRARDGKQAG